jgi:hypothetical protein
MSDIDRIVLYQRYDVDKKILVPRYAALCSREYPLTCEEGLQLGLETALSIARARECARCMTSDSGGRTPLPEYFKEEDVNHLIMDLFGLHSGSTPTTQTGSQDPPKPGRLPDNLFQYKIHLSLSFKRFSWIPTRRTAMSPGTWVKMANPLTKVKPRPLRILPAKVRRTKPMGRTPGPRAIRRRHGAGVLISSLRNTIGMPLVGFGFTIAVPLVRRTSRELTR